MEMDLSTFCQSVHSIKIQFSEGKLKKTEAINRLANLYADFFGLFTASYEEARLCNFYIDDEE